MSEVGRRSFLRLAGASSAAAAGSLALGESIARAAAIPAHRRTGTLADIEHVVVLMQENRSFDHYFGTLRGVRGFADPRPAALPNGKPVWHQSDGAREVLPFRPDADDLGLAFIQDLNHDWRGSHDAFHNGHYDRWIPAKTSTTMAHLTRADIPFHFALADAFTVCDAYHCSFIGSTDPNRYYLWTGYTGNDGAGGGPVLGNEEAGYGWSTYPERLEAAGVSWKVYQDVGTGLDADGSWGWGEDPYIGNYGDNSLLYFHNYRNAKPGDALYEKARTGTDTAHGESLFARLAADVRGHRLPQVSWIAAPEAYTEHPNWPVNYGAWYVAGVLDALTSDPEVWARTALLLTYDENDGFFDHVIPPVPPASAAQGKSTVDVGPDLFAGNGKYAPGVYGLGQRVPMIVVSPWSTGGYVCSQTFDHTSVLRLLERRFGVREPNISPWRRAVCGDLTSAFDFSHRDPRRVRLPDTSGYRPPDHERHPDYVPTPPADPRLPGQEHGRRPVRSLPYAPFTDATHTPDGVTLRFGSGPAAGAAFRVSTPGGASGPWTYTTGAGATVSDTWRGHPELCVSGPNGFLREFAGGAGVEVTARPAGGDLALLLRNTGRAPVTLRFTSAYGRAPRPVRLRPGTTQSRMLDLHASDRWYDLTVTAEHDPTFRRRFAGHVENGRPGWSDPLLG